MSSIFMLCHSVRRALLIGATAVLAQCAMGQSVDFAENNAAQWGTFASDNASRTVVNSTARIKDGTGSLLFTTQSGFDTGIKYPATPTLDFNASSYNHLIFWEYPENSTPIGWQDNQPVVIVRTSTGIITLTPQGQITPNFAWKLFKVPLAGGNGWIRTNTGTPNLAQVRQIEIHHDTWDYGFRIWFDGVRFVQLDPNSLPPPGPTPPPGVDPTIVRSKVLLYVFNPIMENFGSRRMNEVYGWQDPITLAEQTRLDLLDSSHGRAVFEIVDTVLADEYTIFQDGFQHDDETFAQDWANRHFHNSTFDYTAFSLAHNLPARIDQGEFDEVWLYAPPIAGMWESCMAGQGAYWINGPTYPAAGGQKAFVFMGWNFERGVGEAIHSFGHRSENILAYCYGAWLPNRSNTWSRFALTDRDAPGLGGVGNVHFPVNGQSDYDYGNTRYVLSNADAWLSYPNLNESTQSINYLEWSPTGQDTQREYLNWWYWHMPHIPGRAPDFYLGNWWRYLLDVNQFKNSNANLFLTIGIPSISIPSPANNSTFTASSPILITASAEVDGALGRVDFYVDGQYQTSDYIAPYTYAYAPTCGFPNSVTITARALELQNGTQAISTPITIHVDCPPPFCPADFNNDGGVDGQDIESFFIAFADADPIADINVDGGINGEDVEAFFLVWEAGGC